MRGDRAAEQGRTRQCAESGRRATRAWGGNNVCFKRYPETGRRWRWPVPTRQHATPYTPLLYYDTFVLRRAALLAAPVISDGSRRISPRKRHPRMSHDRSRGFGLPLYASSLIASSLPQACSSSSSGNAAAKVSSIRPSRSSGSYRSRCSRTQSSARVLATRPW